MNIGFFAFIKSCLLDFKFLLDQGNYCGFLWPIFDFPSNIQGQEWFYEAKLICLVWMIFSWYNAICFRSKEAFARPKISIELKKYTKRKKIRTLITNNTRWYQQVRLIRICQTKVTLNHKRNYFYILEHQLEEFIKPYVVCYMGVRHRELERR